MPIYLKVDSRELKQKVGEAKQDIMLKMANSFVNFLKEEIPVSSGRGGQSIQILQVSENVIAVGSPLGYLSVIQKGRRPYPHDKSAWPPIKPIKKWTRRKLGEEASVAYAIRHSIGVEGIEPNPFVDRAIDRLMSKYGGEI